MVILKRTYKIVYSNKALKNLKKIPKEYKDKIKERIESLSKDPYGNDFKKVSGLVNTYRSRVGCYRIIYEINNEEVLLLIVEVPNRKDAF